MEEDDASLSDLEAKLRTVLDRLTFFPDEEFLCRFPFGSQLAEEAKQFGGIEEVLDRLGRDSYFDSCIVGIPDPSQRLAAAEIAMSGADGRKRLELSAPGTRKTLGVLAAIPLINYQFMPKEGYERIKTLVCCPTYIIPTWIREAERIFHDPNIVVVTRANRAYAVKKAEDNDVDIVLLGYEMSYRRTGIDLEDPEVKEDMMKHRIDLLSTVYTVEDGLEILQDLMNPDSFEKYRKKSLNVDRVIDKIVHEQRTAEAASIATALRMHAFNNGRPYFAVYDEIHNIIDPHSATGKALSKLFIDADWGVLVTGTGVRNKLSNFAYLAYLDGRIEDPMDFATVFRNNPTIMRAMLDLDANPIKELRDVDSEVPEPELRRELYQRTKTEIEVDLAISVSEIFEGKDQYLLLRYLYTNPQKLLLGNFKDSDKPDSLKSKMQQFYDENPGLEEKIKGMKPSKLEAVRQIVEDARKEGRKVVIACEFSSRLTDYLARELSEYGSVMIDQTVSAQMGEIALTHDEVERLKGEGLYDKRMKYRSQLSLKARSLLGIEHYHIFSPSNRQMNLLEFQTNPDKTVLVATYGTLREGTDVQEAAELIEYEATTVPYKFTQMAARLVRSGQREKVIVHQLAAANSIEERMYLFREWKEHQIRKFLAGRDASPEEIEAFIKDTSPQSSAQIGSLIKLNPRDIIALKFDQLRGVGVHGFVDEMMSFDNAMYLAQNYNYEWAHSFSANCARMISDIVGGIEQKNQKRLDDILDQGCGPATVSRIMGRRATCVDVNKFMLEYGMDACEDAGISGNSYFMGSYTDLGRVVPVGELESHVFDPRECHYNAEGIKDRTMDLSVCSLALDFATEEERKEFFSENKRVLKYGGYLLLVMPTKKMAEQCRPQFIQDVNDVGFEVDAQLTGTYFSSSSYDVDTGEQKKNAFNAYVVVARKVDSAEIEYDEGRHYFRMMPDSIIKEGPSINPDGRMRKRRMRRIDCSGFYNHDTNVDPSQLTPEDATPLPPEIDIFHEVVESAAQSDIDDIAGIIGGLLGGDDANGE